ncbi:MAG: hypothetical protein QM770_17535 [Tepidisphaeraceae bacterium]
MTPTSQLPSVDALVIRPDGTVTPMQDQELKAVQQRIDEQRMHIDQILAERNAARLQNTRQPPAQAKADTQAKADAPADAPVEKPAPQPPTPPAKATVDVAPAVANGVDPEPAANLASAMNVRMTPTITPAPMPTVDPATVTPDIDPLATVTQRFADKVTADPRSLSAQFDLQLARFLKDDMAPSAQDLSSLAPDDREMLSAIVDGLSNFRYVLRNERNPLASQKARPLMEMADRIRQRTDLTVSSMALCTAVRTFGNYDPIEPARFRAGQANTLIFYCEVDGFLTQLAQGDKYETKLSLELRLFTDTDAGIQVWDAKPETVADASRKRRRDFFINKKIVLPPTLPAGRYLLKATVRDLQANRVAERTMAVTLDPK